MTTEITDEDIQNYEARIEGNKIISLSDEGLQKRIKERLRGDVKYLGDPFPWKKLTDKFRLRPGEMTLWAGYSGSGKTQLLNCVMGYLLPMRKVGFASMEMPLDLLAIRMFRQMAGNANPSEEYIDKIIQKLEGRLFLYNVLGNISIDQAVALTSYCAHELKLNHLVIDSMVKCGTGNSADSNDKQTELVNRLQTLVQGTQMHLHLVHHVRKSMSENHVPGKQDIKGAGEIVDMVDNAVIIFRNREKSNSTDSRYSDKPDCLLNVAKQRHGEFEPKVGLFFDKDSLQYTAYEGRKLDWTRNMEWIDSGR